MTVASMWGDATDRGKPTNGEEICFENWKGKVWDDEIQDGNFQSPQDEFLENDYGITEQCKFRPVCVENSQTFQPVNAYYSCSETKPECFSAECLGREVVVNKNFCAAENQFSLDAEKLFPNKKSKPLLPTNPFLPLPSPVPVSMSLKTEPLSMSQAQSMAKLVGPKPLINCHLNEKPYRCLFDTGSMVSVVSSTWVKTEFLSTRIVPLKSDLLTVKVANNSPLSLAGVVFLNFSLPNSRIAISCPFLVAETLSECIVGTNLIKCLYNNLSKTEFSAEISSAVGVLLEDTAVINAMEMESLPGN